MLFRNLGPDNQNQSTLWQDLGQGAATITGFANLCSQAMMHPPPDPDSELELSRESGAILVAAVKRGVVDIRASREPFDSAERFLAVCVEWELDQRWLFLQKSNPEQTVRFLEGFRQLCQSGLVLHHLQREFSLSAAGFERARLLNRSDYEDLLSFAVEIEH